MYMHDKEDRMNCKACSIKKIECTVKHALVSIVIHSRLPGTHVWNTGGSSVESVRLISKTVADPRGCTRHTRHTPTLFHFKPNSVIVFFMSSFYNYSTYINTVVPVMNGHPRDQAKVSVHCRWLLVRGTDGQAVDAKYSTPCKTTYYYHHWSAIFILNTYIVIITVFDLISEHALISGPPLFFEIKKKKIF